MEHLEGILNLSDKELEAIVNNGKFRSREEIDSIYKLVDIVKDAYCIWDMEASMDDEMSYGNESYESGRYARNGRNGSASFSAGTVRKA